MTTFLSALAAGFLTEFCWLAWIYFADRGWPLRSAGASMAIGLFGFLGFASGLNSRAAVVGLILGYGAGSYVAALLRRRMKEPR